MDRAFHRALAAACKNSQIEQTAIRLHNNAARFWCFGIQRTTTERHRAQIQEHLKVVDAIERKDFDEIETLLRGVLGYYPDNRFMLSDSMAAGPGLRSPPKARGRPFHSHGPRRYRAAGRGAARREGGQAFRVCRRLNFAQLWPSRRHRAAPGFPAAAQFWRLPAMSASIEKK